MKDELLVKETIGYLGIWVIGFIGIFVGLFTGDHGLLIFSGIFVLWLNGLENHATQMYILKELKSRG